ncbi:SS18-like protein 2 isoform X1 [Balaenoptera acutorostrata]|uniref:SS18-like protein 2 isoform X1 n=1 Tax=Balaenoptera acutorostrata TaxID=9767 RepID=A0ABM3U8K2_BALAC|nr:SS18-like protein 2 isoform X1 [Balaenoptera acutorostrata]
MSVAFVPDWLRGKAEVNQETIQRLLEENDQLIRCIVEYQNKGRANECVQNYAPFITEKKFYFIVTEAMLFPPPKKVTCNPALNSSVE